MSRPTEICLERSFFQDKESILVTHGGLSLSLFRFPGGVEAVRLRNNRGEIVVLPFQGQQIWSCTFDERPLVMRSMFSQPVSTREYLANYGAFVVHCGASAMGVPGDGDEHPLHGELPNAPYGSAFVELGEDENGLFLTVGGEYEHIVAFNYNYLARPRVTVHEGSSMLDLYMDITNRRHAEMELMYMMHINFRPVDNGELVYSARPSPEKVRVYVSIPAHMKPSKSLEEFKKFLEEVAKNPSLHHTLSPEKPFEPEMVMSISFEEDSEGWAHSLQVQPDGYGSYISHRPSDLPFGIRWISRSADQDALGLVLPATAEAEGYIKEKEKGNLVVLGSGETAQYHTRAGLVTPSELNEVRGKIEAILKG